MIPRQATGATAPLPLGGAGWALAYLALFLALDWVSFIRPLYGLNVTPWNPQPALAIAWLLLRPQGWPMVAGGLLSAELVVRGWPADWTAALSSVAAQTLCALAMARALGPRLNADEPLSTSREVLRLLGVVVLGALATAVLYVASYALAGSGLSGQLGQAVFRYWVGDAVGLVVVLPVLLMAISPRRRGDLRAALRRRELWLLAALLLVLLLLVFGRQHAEHFRNFYLLFLPVVWAAVRMGLAGAVPVSALAQAGLIVAVQASAQPDLSVFELQLLMAALAATGLMLGVTVDERERAAADLRASLHMAAAGQMTAALAHELNQPLTALGSWADAAGLLRADTRLQPEQRLEQLHELTRRMAEDARRAAGVVRRLREFFRSGSTALQHVPLQPLLAEALEAQAARLRLQQVDAQAEVKPAGLAVQADPVQLAVVLRNLLDNALDALAPQAPGGRIRLLARVEGPRVRIDVDDSGPGIEPARRAAMFEPGGSDKPGGLGVGLGICRAIVEAHGGRLWAEPGPGGHLVMTLALDGESAPDGHPTP